MKQTWIAVLFVLLVLTGQGDCRQFRTERELLRQERDLISWFQGVGLKLADVMNRLKKHIYSGMTVKACTLACEWYSGNIFMVFFSDWIAWMVCEPLCDHTLRILQDTVGKKRSRRLFEQYKRSKHLYV